MKNNVVGYAISKEKDYIILSENASGITGTMQDGERKAVQTMCREFLAKTGIETGEDEWTMIGDRLNPKEQSRTVYFFAVVDTASVMDVRSMTEDEVISFWYVPDTGNTTNIETNCILPFILHWDELGLMSFVLLEKA